MATTTWPLPLGAPPRVRALAIGGIGGDAIPPPRSYHRLGFWTLHLYQWRGSVSVDGVAVPVIPGHAGICPPAERIDYRFETAERHLYVHFLPATDAEPVAMPALIDCGDQFDALHARLQAAIGWAETAPTRASARLWEVLWELHHRPPTATLAGGHPAVAAARHLIDQDVARPMRVAELARAVGCSHNHLVRLFRAELGSTVVGYIRARRLAHAKLLLEHSSMPIRAIAAYVGIADAAQFARHARRMWGKTAGAVRASALG